MKIMKYLGLAVVLLAGALLLVGIFVPSFEYTSTVTIHSTPEKCWQALNDSSRMKEWVDGFKSISLKQGQDLQVGAVYELVVIQDKKYIMYEVLKEVRIPEKIAFTLTNEVMTSEYDYVLQSKDSSTLITSHYQIIGKNIVWKSVLFLSKSYLKENADTLLARFKIEVEAGDMEFD